MLALGVVYTLYFAKTLIVPVVIALMLTLLLGPLVSLLKRHMVPRSLSAVVLLGLILGPLILLLSELREPVERWVERTPDLSERLDEQIQTFQTALGGGDATPESASEDAEGFFSNLFGGEEEEEESAETSPVMEGLTRGGIELGLYVFAAAPLLLAQLVTCLTLTIFLLVFGPRLFEAAITHLPQISDKVGARALVSTVQVELSRFILSLSAINALLGLTVAGALTLLGLDDALLWGVLVGVLNFAPYVGTLIGMAILTLAGLAQFGVTPEALLPVLVYFVINGIEAQFITPTVMGQNMRLNPLVLMIWLIFWAWLWGMVGVLLAVPLLVCIKLAASQLNVPNHWVRVVETHA
ncbi:MAG: AI-2E family transporter [Pseudomonadota bacterium]